MFIKFVLKEEVIISAELYTQNPSKALRNYVFSHYLFKILNLGNESSGICVKIQGIQLIDNVILRKTADLKAKIKISLIILRLMPDEYYEGIVRQSTPSGIIVNFFSDLLSGLIPLTGLHSDTIYNEEQNEWILTPQKGGKGYPWKNGAKIGFKIKKTKFGQPNIEEMNIEMADLIELRANEAGLGPKQWWV